MASAAASLPDPQTTPGSEKFCDTAEAAMDETLPSDERIRRYLLGELSESEQTALEEECFADRSKYDRLLRAEDNLIDDYTRGYLSMAERSRFERHFQATPRRRERIAFARAFTRLVDQECEAQSPALAPIFLEEAPPPRRPFARAPSSLSWIQALMDRLRPLAWPAFAPALLLLGIGGLWFQSRVAEMRAQLAQAQRESEAQRERGRALEAQVASQNEKNRQLTEELDRLRRLQETRNTPSSPFGFAPASILLTLSLDALRDPGAGAATRLVIPRGTEQARIRLKFTENFFPRYQVTLQTADGKTTLSRKALKSVHAKTGDALSFSVPAAKFVSGEYILALGGIGAGGAVESLGKTVITVKKQ
jgi:anti-sigma factor RsiW